MGNRIPVNGHEEPFEVIGVGFGPAGVALAVAIEDAAEERPLESPWNALFVEQAPDSSWQPDMLLPGTDIQHHFLRDFATPRNPRSRYTFPNYLKEAGRLFAFGLLGGSPGRIEWADYCSWVAQQVADRALYRHEVDGIEPVVTGPDGAVELLRVNALDLERGVTKSFLAENVVLCTGRKPQIPDVFEPWLGNRIFHSHHFLTSVATLPPEEAPTIAVIGSGQNAIEILLYLIDRYPQSEIYSINRNSGFRLYDLGHFSNQVYWPDEVEYFYWLPKAARHTLLKEVKFTNYSSVDADVSRALYWRIYEDEIQGKDRIHVLKRSSVTEVISDGERLELAVEDVYCGQKRPISVDAVFLCTGYFDQRVPSLFDGVRQYLVLDDDGDMCISRDYEVRTTEQMQAGIFVNGLTELTHGISDAASFSMVALKAARTLERLEATRAARRETRRPTVERLVS
jgi:L-ornithine N5-oxygenase